MQAVFVVWAAYSVAFVALYQLPSDPVVLMLAGRSGNATAIVDLAQAAAVRAEYGFDQPPWRQYLSLLGKAARGDLGASMQTGQPVVATIADGLAATAPLAGLALLLAVLFGMGLPMLAVLGRTRPLRAALDTAPVVWASLPTFWVGLLLLRWFSFDLPLFPAVGQDGFASLVLPAVTIALPTAAVLAQVFGRNLRQAMTEPYVDLVYAKGAGRAWVLWRHGLRNACLPLVAVTGVVFGNLLAGAVVVESVFARDGLGQVTVDAVTTEDLPVVLGLVVFTGLLFVLVSFAVNLVHAALDPRTRHDNH